MEKRRRYPTAGPGHKRKLLDQAQAWLGYHRKSAIRALGTPKVEVDTVALCGGSVAGHFCG